MRLNQYIARCGVTSRRKADVLIAEGLVLVNGVPATVGEVINEIQDTVTLDGIRLELQTKLVYYLVYKPRGMVTSVSDPDGKPVVVSMTPAEERVYPVGRLDEDSEGLLLLTNDGDFAYRLTHPSHVVEKEYEVTVRGRVSKRDLSTLTDSMELAGERMEVDEATVVGQKQGESVLRLVLHQGRHRQIRRMLGTLGYEVLRLVRVRIGPFTLQTLGGRSVKQLTARVVREFGI